jgi:hypothetical protein
MRTGPREKKKKKKEKKKNNRHLAQALMVLWCIFLPA